MNHFLFTLLCVRLSVENAQEKQEEYATDIEKFLNLVQTLEDHKAELTNKVETLTIEKSTMEAEMEFRSKLSQAFSILSREEVDLERLKLLPIDCVVVNFYPFEKAASQPGIAKNALIEEIDCDDRIAAGELRGERARGGHVHRHRQLGPVVDVGVVRLVVLATEVDALLRPQGLHHLDHFIGVFAAPFPVDAHGIEVFFCPAHAHAENNAAIARRIESR